MGAATGEPIGARGAAQLRRYAMMRDRGENAQALASGLLATGS
jgi:hypothetical protein